MLDTLKKIVVLLSQIVQLLSQRQVHSVVDMMPHAEVPEPEEGELLIDEARRRIAWKGGACNFNGRKAKRYDFFLLLWSRAGEYVTAEEIAVALFDGAKWRWSSIRRYGKRIQEDDLGPKNCPFYIRIEAEGFTLLPLF